MHNVWLNAKKSPALVLTLAFFAMMALMLIGMVYKLTVGDVQNVPLFAILTIVVALVAGYMFGAFLLHNRDDAERRAASATSSTDRDRVELI